jgi:mono/diheme cytochrome c family protein
MKRFLALAVLALALPAVPARGDEPVLVESGRRSFERHCSACHGMNAAGEGILKPVLRVTPPDLTRIAARRGGVFPEAEIASFIDGRAFVQSHGSREMPVWGRVFSAPIAEDTDGEDVVRGQLWILVEYLKSIQVPAAPSP